MAQRDRANLCAPARPIFEEQVIPGPLAQTGCVHRIPNHQKNPIFIEQSHPVTKAPTRSADAVPRNLGRLKLMQDCLDPRKTKPRQRIEKIVEGTRPVDSGWNCAERRDRLLVRHRQGLAPSLGLCLGLCLSLGNKAQRLFGPQKKSPRNRHPVEAIQTFRGLGSG